MPNEMKPNQSFSPINQGPEAKPLHKRPDNSFVTVTLWTISGVVLAACSGGSNVIRDIGGDPADVPSTDVTVPHIQGAVIIYDGVRYTTDALGQAQIPTEALTEGITVELEGAKHQLTGLEVGGQVESFAGGSFASPLTTLIVEVMREEGLTAEDALIHIQDQTDVPEEEFVTIDDVLTYSKYLVTDESDTFPLVSIALYAYRTNPAPEGVTTEFQLELIRELVNGYQSASDELAAGEVRYRHDASEAPETNLSLTITAPFGATVSHLVAVAVTPVNDSPELALSGGVSATFNAQNDAANILTGEVTISDPDHNLNQLRLTLGSRESAITFNISGPSQYIQVGEYGVLTIFNHGSDSEGARFSWQYDFQAADKDVDEGTANRFAALQALPAGAVARDTFTISVSDGALTAQQEVTFNVTAIDDPYEVTSHFRFIEDIETDGLIGQVEARDPDGGANSGPFFYRLVTLRQGDDQDSSQSAYDDVSSLYHLDATTGRLTFIGDRIDPDANANRERIYLEIAIHESASLDAASEVERITHHSDIININEGNPIISYRDQITLDEGATTPMILDNRYLKGSDLDADPALGVIYRIIDTGGAVIRRAGEERGPDHAYDAFTQRDIDTGTISILFTETGTLILEVDDGQGNYPDVNTAEFGGVPKQTQRLEIDLVFRTIDDLDGEPTTGGNEIDRRDEEVGRVIDTGDDNDVISDTGGDDVIRPGKGDDKVYLDASHDDPDDPDNPLMVNDDIDIYVYQFGAYDDAYAASDGSDHVTGFQRGIDQFKLLAHQTGTTSPPSNKEAFFSFVEGADKDTHFDDLLLISPTIEVDGAAIFRDLVAGVYQSENEDDYISFTEIILQFSAGSIYSHGRVSMPYMIIEFDEPVPYQEFKAIVGDKHNGGHNVITDFSLLDDLLGGDVSFAYEVI